MDDAGYLAVPVATGACAAAVEALVKYAVVHMVLPPSKPKGPPTPHELLKASVLKLLTAYGLSDQLVSPDSISGACTHTHTHTHTHQHAHFTLLIVCSSCTMCNTLGIVARNFATRCFK